MEQEIKQLLQELASARETLIQLRYQNEMLLHWVEGGVLLVDREGLIIEANPVALRALDRTTEELIGKKCHETFHHTLEDGNEYPWDFCPVFAALEDGSSHHVDGDVFWHKDGSSFSVDYIACPTRDEQNVINGAILVFRNLTEIKLQEAKRIHGMKLESIGELSAGIAHEINTPMQFVASNLDFLREGCNDLLKLSRHYGSFRKRVSSGEDCSEWSKELEEMEEEIDIDYLEEEVPEAFAQTLDGVERVTKLVQGLKGFSHSAGDQNKQEVDINSVIKNTLIVCKNEYKYVAQVLTELGDIPSINGYHGDIGQVILNLVVNAAHTIADKIEEGDEIGTITIKTTLDGDGVLISVSDTGKGIPQSIENRIFDPFFTTKTVGKGSGQGLAIARTIIHDKHKGSLTFSSTPEEGTSFFIRLPVKGD